MWGQIHKRLSLCHGTLATVSPPAFVSAAGGAGFRAVSLKVLIPKSNVPASVMGGYPLTGNTSLRRETRRRLQDTGIAVLESETAVVGPLSRATEFEALLETAAFLGSRGTIVVFFGQDSEARIVDQFNEFSDLAHRYEQQAVIEFLPLSAVKTVGAAVRVLRKSVAKNGQLMVDMLHWTRSGGTLADIQSVSPALLHACQLSDGPVDYPFDRANWANEMSGARSFLGEGDFRIVEVLQSLPPELPLGLEVISRRFLASEMPADEMAAQAMANARRYFERISPIFDRETPK
jgi:sugar phosphate isomerase/epimerase